MGAPENSSAPEGGAPGEGLRIDHEFKSHPDVFWPAARGEKTFEFRRNDRGGFHVGQTVRLRCYDPDHGFYGHPPLDRRITNILRGGEFGLQDGYCILSLASLASPASAPTPGIGGGDALREALEWHRDRLFQPHQSGNGYRFGDAGTTTIRITNAEARAALAQPQLVTEPSSGGERVRHVKRGTEYEVIGEAEAQISGITCPDGIGNGVLPKSALIREGRAGYESDRLTVYRCVATGKLYCRLTHEFRDGRFETLSAPTQTPRDGGAREALEWRPMKDAPADGKTQIVVRHRPNEHTPHGWIATITTDFDDPDEDRRGGLDTIIHYNGDRLVSGFHGMWTGWMYPEEFAALSAPESVGPGKTVIPAIGQGATKAQEDAFRRKYLAPAPALPATGEETEEKIARMFARVRGHSDLDHGIMTTGGVTKPVWTFYRENAREVLDLLASPHPAKTPAPVEGGRPADQTKGGL